MLPEVCLGCKACCTNVGVNLFEEDNIPENMIETIALRPDKYPPLGREFKFMKHKINGECIALTTDGRCSIYETRPTVCVDFERGSKDCLDLLDKLGV